LLDVYSPRQKWGPILHRHDVSRQEPSNESLDHLHESLAVHVSAGELPVLERSEILLGAHGSWGLGLAVPASDSANVPVPCGIGWDGGAGPTWRSRAGDRTTGTLVTQRQATSPTAPSLLPDFWSGVNAAVSTR
jgi:hypothetical protein